MQRRYDRTDSLVQEYIRRFLEVPAILNRANSQRIRTIIDATNQMIRALPSLGADVHHWDPFICLIISSKLDEETRRDWKQHIGRRTNATVSELVEFLETRAIDQQPSQGDRLSQMLRNQGNQRNTRRNVFAVTQNAPAESSTPATPKASTSVLAKKPVQVPKKKRTCIFCQGDHLPWQCSRLRKESVRVRNEIVNSVGACLKCLLKHEVGTCQKSDCPYCGEDHNSLLCFKKERDQKRAIEAKERQQPQTKKDKFGNQSSADDWSENQ